MKRVLAIITMLVLSSGLLSAAPKELSILWFYDDPAELEFVKKAAADYSAKNPGVTFKVNTVPFGDLYAKLTQMIAGNNPPDIIKLDQYRPEFAPFIQDFNKSLGRKYLDNYMKAPAATMIRGNKMIGIPLDVSANGIILNKSLFDKAGVAIPNQKTAWTWDQFIKAITTVRNKTGVKFPVGWDVTPHRWMTYFYEHGARMFTPDGKNAFNSPAALAAFKGWQKMFKDGTIPSSTWAGTENPRDMFFSGQAVAWMSGTWQVKAMTSDIKSFTWSAGPNPYVKVRSSVSGGKYITSFVNSKYPKDAVDFIAYFTGKDVARSYAQLLMVPSPRTDIGVINYGNASATAALNNLGNELTISPLQASTDQLSPAWVVTLPHLKEQIINVIIGKATPEQAVAAVSAKIDEALAATGKK
jgi:alpha-1,4-digalacturonate transport system substrate-binding protein